MLAVGEHVLDQFPDVCKRMGAGFFGGVGGTRQELCGALSGALLVTGALLGRVELDEDDRAAMNVAALYRARFQGKFGETLCAPLRDRVLASEELGSCAALVEESTRLFLSILLEAQQLAEHAGLTARSQIRQPPAAPLEAVTTSPGTRPATVGREASLPSG